MPVRWRAPPGSRRPAGSRNEASHLPRAASDVLFPPCQLRVAACFRLPPSRSREAHSPSCPLGGKETRQGVGSAFLLRRPRRCHLHCGLREPRAVRAPGRGRDAAANQGDRAGARRRDSHRQEHEIGPERRARRDPGHQVRERLRSLDLPDRERPAGKSRFAARRCAQRAGSGNADRNRRARRALRAVGRRRQNADAQPDSRETAASAITRIRYLENRHGGLRVKTRQRVVGGCCVRTCVLML